MANNYSYTPDPSLQFNQSTMDLFNKPSEDNSEYGNNKDYRNALKDTARSAQHAGAAGGGLGGMLTSGGTTLGIASLGAAPTSQLAGMGGIGLGAAGAGLILSAIEKNKAEKAAREQQAIDNEMTKRQNLIQLARDAANQDFRIA